MCTNYHSNLAKCILEFSGISQIVHRSAIITRQDVYIVNTILILHSNSKVLSYTDHIGGLKHRLCKH